MESEFPPSVYCIVRPSTTKKIVVSHEAKVISHRKCIIFNAITIIRQFGKLSSAKTFLKEINVAKGHLISKANSQAEDSPKKRTNEFVFTTVRRVFVCFLGESLA